MSVGQLEGHWEGFPRGKDGPNYITGRLMVQWHFILGPRPTRQALWSHTNSSRKTALTPVWEGADFVSKWISHQPRRMNAECVVILRRVVCQNAHRNLNVNEAKIIYASARGRTGEKWAILRKCPLWRYQLITPWKSWIMVDFLGSVHPLDHHVPIQTGHRHPGLWACTAIRVQDFENAIYIVDFNYLLGELYKLCFRLQASFDDSNQIHGSSSVYFLQE